MSDSSLAVLCLYCGSSSAWFQRKKGFSRQSREDGKKAARTVQCYLGCSWSLAMPGAGSRLAHWEHVHG